MSGSDALDEKRRKAARLLVYDCYTHAETAEAVDVSERTVSRWRKEEAFQAHIAELQAERDETARRKMGGLMADAANVVRIGLDRMAGMLQNADMKPSDVASVVGAAQRVLTDASNRVGPVERSETRVQVASLSDEVAAARALLEGADEP